MKWPDREGSAQGSDTPHLWLDASGRLGVSPDYVTQADDRFEAVCEELGILLARRVEPVSARVLPFGTEQLAMVQLKDASAGTAEFHAATARGASPAAAVAGAAINAATGGQTVLATALPGAVAEGKVRTAVVFTDGEPPVRWGLPDDETRLASLYAVVPHLGSFTATTDSDTYRVLRLPGIGVALVSEGPSAAAWVEGWFAALLQATQFALRATPAPTDLVAVPTAAPTSEPVDDGRALALQVIEEECRRILAAAQDEAREIRDAARQAAQGLGSPDADGDQEPELDGSLAADSPWRRTAPQPPTSDDTHDEQQLQTDLEASREAVQAAHEVLADAERTRAAMVEEARAEAAQVLLDAEHARVTVLEEARRDADRLVHEADRARLTLLTDAKRQSDGILADAERTRTTMLADAKRDAEALVRDADHARSTVLADAKREADATLRDAERQRSTLLEDARRDADSALRDAERERTTILAETKREAAAVLRETERSRSSLLSDARREAEAVLREADRVRRDADDALRDAEQLRRRADETAVSHTPAGTDAQQRVSDRTSDVLIGEARRVADGIIHDARRSAEELIRDATVTRRNLLDAVPAAPAATPAGPDRAPGSGPRGVEVPPTAQVDAGPTPTDAAAAMLAAAAESVSAMAALVRQGTAAPRTAKGPSQPDDGAAVDLSTLFYGA